MIRCPIPLPVPALRRDLMPITDATVEAPAQGRGAGRA